MNDIIYPPAMKALLDHPTGFYMEKHVPHGPFSVQQHMRELDWERGTVHEWQILDCGHQLIRVSRDETRIRESCELLNLAYAEYLMLKPDSLGYGYANCLKCAQRTASDVSDGMHVCARCGVLR